MNIFRNRIKENKSSRIIGWLGLAVAIVGIGITIYYEGIKKEEPHLEYSIIAKTDFFNSTENATYLKVLIDDTINVQKNHLNITTYSIKVENKGSKHINDIDYVKGFFGLKVDNGILLDIPVIISSSDDYLEKSFFVDTNAKGKSVIELPKMTIDKKDNYVIKVVLIHNVDSIPQFHTVGKIIGQKEIEIKETLESDDELKATAIYSILIGFFLAVLIFYLNMILEDMLSNRKDIRRREKQQKTLWKEHEDEIKDLQNIMPSVKDEYIKNGYWAIALLELIFSNKEESKTSEEYRKMNRYIRYKTHAPKEEYDKVKAEYDQYNHYIDEGFFLLNEDFTITYNKDAIDSVKKLYNFLDEKRKTKTTPQKSLKEILDTPIS